MRAILWRYGQDGTAYRPQLNPGNSVRWYIVPKPGERQFVDEADVPTRRYKLQLTGWEFRATVFEDDGSNPVPWDKANPGGITQPLLIHYEDRLGRPRPAEEVMAKVDWWLTQVLPNIARETQLARTELEGRAVTLAEVAEVAMQGVED